MSCDRGIRYVLPALSLPTSWQKAGLLNGRLGCYSTVGYKFNFTLVGCWGCIERGLTTFDGMHSELGASEHG